MSNAFSEMGLQGQIWNLLYLSQKWFDCHETKSKHIYWTLGLKWDHPFDLGHARDLGIQGQVWNLLYLSQNGLIAMKQKANLAIKI